MSASATPDFQAGVAAWIEACFGANSGSDVQERTNRFLEEALELGQASGCAREDAHLLVDYVFGRPKGEIHQEVGGTMTTLAALCTAHRVNMQESANVELARNWVNVEKIRAKRTTKPEFGPLPASPDFQASEGANGLNTPSVPLSQTDGSPIQDELSAMRQRKDAAYAERSQCVALIARMALALGMPVAVMKTAIPGWSEDWHGCVYIGLPTGQVSWHFNDSHADLFDGLPTASCTWDGHDTSEKYRRVNGAFPR